MIPYSQLEKGVKIIIEKDPYEIMEASSMFKGRGHSVLQARLKNLKTGEMISKTFHPSGSFQEAEIEKIKVCYIYENRDSYFFYKNEDSSQRFSLTKEQLGSVVKFLKPEIKLGGVVFKDEIVNILLPIKVHLKVKQAPPGIKGNTAEGGTKTITLETGAEISAPLFIQEGDIIEVNTEKEEYVRRIEKK